MKILPFIALMLTSLSMNVSLAALGAGSSGGGNALVCFDSPEIPKQIRERDQAGNIIDGSIRNEHIKHITRLEVLDLVEAQFARGMSQPKLSDLIQPEAGEDVEEFSKRIITRFKDVAPLLYDNLMARLNEMPAGEAVAQPDGLYPVDDYNLLGRIDSTNCVVATVAIHQFTDNDLKGAPQLYFDQRLMFHPKHTDFSRAVTYLHEVVYSYARSFLDHRDSQDTRKLIGLMLRKNIKVAELQKMINESNFNNRFNNRNGYNFIPFMWSQRSDRLGYIYTKFNMKAYSLAQKLLTYGTNARADLVEKYDAKILVELQSFVEDSSCMREYHSGRVTCLLSRVEATSKLSPIFTRAKRVKEAKALMNKYANYGTDREKFVLAGLTPALQKELKNLYEENYKDQLLNISNVAPEKLMQINSIIEGTIEKNMDLLVKRGSSSEQDGEMFIEVGALLAEIPVQNNL